MARERPPRVATPEQAIDALRNVYDPEIPVNIVELGLVYDVTVADGVARVTMTLTAPACSMGPMIAADARARLLCVEGIRDAEVEIVLSPPWDPTRMSEAARRSLGITDDAPNLPLPAGSAALAREVPDGNSR